MGEVYRAHDKRLGRDVALKMLFADVATNTGAPGALPPRGPLFAALNHPNIVTIFPSKMITTCRS